MLNRRFRIGDQVEISIESKIEETKAENGWRFRTGKRGDRYAPIIDKHSKLNKFIIQ